MSRSQDEELILGNRFDLEKINEFTYFNQTENKDLTIEEARELISKDNNNEVSNKKNGENISYKCIKLSIDSKEIVCIT